MPIIFEKIGTTETLAISAALEGKWYRSKLTAIINSSDLGRNADRGQDYDWRLQAEQRALIEEWESDPQMIDKVSNFTKVPLDSLEHGEFLAYMLHLEEAGVSEARTELAAKRANQAAYEARVEALKAKKAPEPLAPFKADLTLEEFIGDDAPKPATKKK